MRERGFGQIINMSSAGVQTEKPTFGAYIASKPLDTLCDSLQAETVSDGVRFTTVYMALVKTPMIGPTKVYDKFPTQPDELRRPGCWPTRSCPPAAPEALRSARSRHF